LHNQNAHYLLKELRKTIAVIRNFESIGFFFHKITTM
jgi:hypothetical protein